MVMTGLCVVAGADGDDGKVPARRAVAVTQVLADVADQDAHLDAVAGRGAERVVACHPEDVPEPSGLVLEAAVALGQRDEALPGGTGQRDRDPEPGLAGGVGHVDEDAVLDRLAAGVPGRRRGRTDRRLRCRAWRSPCSGLARARPERAARAHGGVGFGIVPSGGRRALRSRAPPGDPSRERPASAPGGVAPGARESGGAVTIPQRHRRGSP